LFFSSVLNLINNELASILSPFIFSFILFFSSTNIVLLGSFTFSFLSWKWCIWFNSKRLQSRRLFLPVSVAKRVMRKAESVADSLANLAFRSTKAIFVFSASGFSTEFVSKVASQFSWVCWVKSNLASFPSLSVGFSWSNYFPLCMFTEGSQFFR